MKDYKFWLLDEINEADKSKEKDYKAIEEACKTKIKESDDYKEYFQKKLKAYKVETPDELSDEDKKKFYDDVDAGWEGEEEGDEKMNESIGYDELQKIRQELTDLSKKASKIKSTCENKETARIAANVEADIDKIRMNIFKYNEIKDSK